MNSRGLSKAKPPDRSSQPSTTLAGSYRPAPNSNLLENADRFWNAYYDAGGKPLTDLLTAFSQKHPDLASVVEAWPELTEAVRARIVGIVEVATDLGPGSRAACNSGIADPARCWYDSALRENQNARHLSRLPTGGIRRCPHVSRLRQADCSKPDTSTGATSEHAPRVL